VLESDEHIKMHALHALLCTSHSVHFDCCDSVSDSVVQLVVNVLLPDLFRSMTGYVKFLVYFICS
jgi:hypothetical protein